MKLFYCRKMVEGRNAPLMSFVMILSILFFMHFYFGSGDGSPAPSPIITILVLGLPLLLSKFLKALKRGKRWPVFLEEPSGRLYLVPARAFSSSDPVIVKALLSRMECSSTLPAEALEIQHVLSVHALGPVFWIRCVIQGKLLVKNLLLTKSYTDYNSLLTRLEIRAEDGI